MTDNARQHPADAMLRNQPAARKRRRKDRVVGGKTQIAIQRVHQPNAGGGTVQHADDRFGNRRIIRVARLPVGPAVHIERRHALAAPDVAGIEPLQPLHIGAGAERASRTGEHDDPHIVIRGRGFHRAAHIALHDRRPRVHALRPVERDGRDLLAHVVENMLIGHLRSPCARRRRCDSALLLISYKRPGA